MSQNLLLEDLIQKALSKVNGKKERDLCRFLPCSRGYMHHFTFRKMMQENPQQLFDLIQEYIIEPEKPQEIHLKPTVEVHETKPETFNPQAEVAACYLECDGKLLLLLNAPSDSEAGSWGVPAGKLESNEPPLYGAIRELFEETSISIDPSQIHSIGSLYIRKPEVDYIYHLFRIKVISRPKVRLSPEHQNYRWVSAEEMEMMPIMIGGKEAYARYRALASKKRIGASVNAYLILKQEDKILLHLRRNTGYCDGMWSLIAGHVEDGESATEGMSREAYEEIGIQIEPLKLKVVHVMHRKTNRLNVDIFFECASWEGSIINREPDKCEHIAFFPLDTLPLNIVDYNVTALKAIQEGNFYSEYGWTS